MTPTQATSMYRRRMAPFETVVIRKYEGTGASRTKFDWTVQARVFDTQTTELVGAVVETTRKGIILHEDLVAAKFPYDAIGTGQNWRLIVDGKELAIKSVDPNTRRVGGQTIAYDIVIGGA